MVVSPTKDSVSLPGEELFIRAMELLPDPAYMFNEPIASIEMLCVIALYLQAADMRTSAYICVRRDPTLEDGVEGRL